MGFWELVLFQLVMTQIAPNVIYPPQTLAINVKILMVIGGLLLVRPVMPAA